MYTLKRFLMVSMLSSSLPLFPYQGYWNCN